MDSRLRFFLGLGVFAAATTLVAPAAAAPAAPSTAPVDHHYENRLAAVFKARGVSHFKPAQIRDIALAQLETGAPAGVLASISEREFSHNTVRVPGSIPGTVSSGGYFSPFAFKPSSWDYYKGEVWGSDARNHDPFNYADAAVMAGTILQHYRAAGNSNSNRMQVDPLGSLKEYNSNYAVGVLEDAKVKYGSPLWRKLVTNLAELKTGVQAADQKPPKPTSESRLMVNVLRVLGVLPSANGAVAPSNVTGAAD